VETFYQFAPPFDKWRGRKEGFRRRQRRRGRVLVMTVIFHTHAGGEGGIIPSTEGVAGPHYYQEERYLNKRWDVIAMLSCPAAAAKSKERGVLVRVCVYMTTLFRLFAAFARNQRLPPRAKNVFPRQRRRRRRILEALSERI